MLYAIKVYVRWDDRTWERVGYEIIFRDISKALSYAYKKTHDAHCFRYYGIEKMTEAAARVGGLEDLIES